MYGDFFKPRVQVWFLYRQPFYGQLLLDWIKNYLQLRNWSNKSISGCQWKKQKIINNAWKVTKCGVIAGPYFPTFGLNAERYATLSEKCPNMELFLVRIFQHSDWIRRNTKYLSVCSPNVGKCGPEIAAYLDTFHSVSPPIGKSCRVTDNKRGGTRERDKVALFQV